MKQTVVLKLREVDGRLPDLSEEVFCRTMPADQGFSPCQTLSVQSFVTGLFYVTFASMEICRRYWEAVKSAAPGSPFKAFLGSCPVQMDERRVTVTMRNPHTPPGDIARFLARFCTVLRDPTRILNKTGYWTGKWSVVVKLRRDGEVRHLPQTFSLGNSSGLIWYPDLPKACRRCGKEGHQVKDCKADACRMCRVEGHATKDCPTAKTCNLCGMADHVYKACKMRTRSWASVAKEPPSTVVSAGAKAGPAKASKAPAGNAKAPAARAGPSGTQARAQAATKEKKPGPEKEKKKGKAKGKKSAPLPTSTPTEVSTPIVSTTSVDTPVNTQPPTRPSPEVALTVLPPATSVLSMEEFPPLPCRSLVSSEPPKQPKKRKDREDSDDDSSKKIAIEASEDAIEVDVQRDPIPEVTELEKRVDELVDDSATEMDPDIVAVLEGEGPPSQMALVIKDLEEDIYGSGLSLGTPELGPDIDDGSGNLHVSF
ncbi:uncharacterized protein LOC142196598 [Leptodactylus fuscus]|uniref:uncharacterized protein LOC142196598 n=1 Tax=Leptodactylus fuscus TaxID=238119 RepID=UPI003F4ECC31